MSSLRRRLWSATAVSIGVLLVLGGLSAPAQATTARTVGLGAKPTAAVSGSKILLSGYVSKSPTGSTVKLQRKSGSTWITSTLTKTKTSSGYFSFSVTASSTAGTYSYRAAVSATSKLGAATSKTVTVTALRKVTVSIKASPSTLALGAKTTISGTVKPFVSGDVGFIQRYNGVKWIDLTTADITSKGTFSRTFTPQASTTYRFYVPRQGFNATGTSVGTRVSIPTGPQPPVITTTSLPNGFTEKAYSQTLTKTGEAGTWAITAGALPPGLTLSSSGTIAGTPTAGGTFNFTVTFSQSGNLLNDSQNLSIKVLVTPKITTTALPDATGFVTYGPVTLQKSAQAGAWSITSGTLPTGISFDTATGTLSGKPTVKAAGDYPLTFKYTETAAPQLSATKQLTLHLNAAPAPVITTTSLTSATAFSTYSFSLTKTGKAGTWSVTGSLPTGVTFDTATGALSGKPTVSGDFPLTFTFTESESGTFASKPLTLHVDPAPDPVITTTSLPPATAFSTYTATLAKTGNAGTWSVTGSLPTGVTFDTATGTLSGKPTVSGDFPLTFTFTESESGTFASKPLTLHVNAAPKPVITTTALTDGQAFKNYTTTLTRTGNAGTWSSTALPSGLSLDPATGVLSGRPTVSGDFSITFTFTETESAAFGTKTLSLHLEKAPDPVITTTTLPAVLIDFTYNQTLTKTGNAGTWSLSAGALPAGLSLDADTGVISGAPTVSGTFNFTVKFTETEAGTFDTQALSLVVYSRPTITTTGLPDALKDNTYSATLTKSGGTGSGTWSVSAGALPTGLSLSSAGAITGTATVNGDYNFTVRFVDGVTNVAAAKALSIHVGPTAIKTGSLADAKVGVAYSVQLDGAPSGISGWALASGSTLPPGLTLSGSGLLSGTPTAAGDYTFDITYSVLLKPSRTRTFTLHVNP